MKDWSYYLEGTTFTTELLLDQLLIYLLSTIVDLCFSVQKLAIFSSNPGRVHFDGLVQLLVYIGDNKHLGLIYYANIEHENLSNILRQASIKTEDQFMVF